MLAFHRSLLGKYARIPCRHDDKTADSDDPDAGWRILVNAKDR